MRECGRCGEYYDSGFCPKCGFFPASFNALPPWGWPTDADAPPPKQGHPISDEEMDELYRAGLQ